MTSEKLALTLILSRQRKATITKNRALTLLDIDKMISFQSQSIKEGDQRMQQLKNALNQSSLKVSYNSLVPNRMVEEVNTGNLQIFRLVRAAQMHLLTATQFVRQSEE